MDRGFIKKRKYDLSGIWRKDLRARAGWLGAITCTVANIIRNRKDKKGKRRTLLSLTHTKVACNSSSGAATVLFYFAWIFLFLFITPLGSESEEYFSTNIQTNQTK